MTTPSRPGPYALRVRRGTRYERPFTYKIDGDPVDLTGYTARAQIRRRASEDSPVLFEATTANGKLELSDDPTDGTFTLTITADETAAFEFKHAVWDLELIPDGAEENAFALLEGPVHVAAQVTQ